MPFARVAKPRSSRFYVRFQPEEKELLAVQARKAGITMSAYVRRRALGLPVKSRVSEQMINELRRLGGLQKLLALQHPADERVYRELLESIVAAIARLDIPDEPAEKD